MAHVDVISDVLAAALRAFPNSDFVQGLSHQYLIKGGLSKRQLEGLHKKVQGVADLSPGKLATLEAIILRRHQKYRSPLPEPVLHNDSNQQTKIWVEEILARYPQHKRVVFFSAKLQKAESLNPSEVKELERFYKLLVK